VGSGAGLVRRSAGECQRQDHEAEGGEDVLPEVLHRRSLLAAGGWSDPRADLDINPAARRSNLREGGERKTEAHANASRSYTRGEEPRRSPEIRMLRSRLSRL